MRTLVLVAMFIVGCNGVPPNVEGAPCEATTATFKEIACGYSLNAGQLHTRCVLECKRDLGHWVVQTCLPECGTGGFYVGEPGETGECYLPTVSCSTRR